MRNSGFGSAAPQASSFGIGGASPAFGFGSAQAAQTQSAAGFGQIRAAFGSSSSSGSVDVSDEQFNQQLQQAMRSGGFDQADSNLGESETGKLLRQLEREPDNDEERASKFLLYEQFSTTVSEARKAMLDFWQDAVQEFGAPSGGARQAVEHEIGQMDSHDRMTLRPSVSGVGFGAAPRWFVYDMVTQANSNTKMIEALLSSMKAKLQVLSEQNDSECPVCLGEMGSGGADAALGEVAAGRGVTILACCHKTCTSCWDNWRNIGGSNCCPLCRKEDFILRIYGAI